MYLLKTGVLEGYICVLYALDRCIGVMHLCIEGCMSLYSM